MFFESTLYEYDDMMHIVFYICVMVDYVFLDFLFLPVQTLTMISSKLNNKYWKTLDRSSCNSADDFNKTFPGLVDIYSNVSCDCSFSKNSVCHVTHMYDSILTFFKFNMSICYNIRGKELSIIVILCSCTKGKTEKLKIMILKWINISIDLCST